MWYQITLELKYLQLLLSAANTDICLFGNFVTHCSNKVLDKPVASLVSSANVISLKLVFQSIKNVTVLKAISKLPNYNICHLHKVLLRLNVWKANNCVIFTTTPSFMLKCAFFTQNMCNHFVSSTLKPINYECCQMNFMSLCQI